MDSSNDSAISMVAREKSEKILVSLERHGLRTSKIQSLLEGGLSIRIRGESRYSDIEIDNDGEIVYVVKAKGEPASVWCENEHSLEESLSLIRQFLTV